MKRSLSLAFGAILLLTACSSLEHYAETGELATPDLSLPKISSPFKGKKEEPKPAEAPVAAAVPAGKTTTVTVLHINDWHSQHEPLRPTDEPEQGGIARLSGLINKIRAEKGKDNVLLLSGGDNYQGSFFYTAWKGSAEVMALNHIKLDAACFGNHEFDNGPAELARSLSGNPIEIAGKTYATERANYLSLGTNVDATASPELAKLFTKTAIIERGGERYGLLGVTTDTTAVISSPGNVLFLPYVQSVQAGVDELEKQGINKIILMSHTGYEEDLRFIQNVRGVDMIIAGHDHALTGDKEAIKAMGLPKQADRVKGVYPTLIKGSDGRNVLVVSAMEKGRWLGQIDVTFDDKGEIAKGAWKANPVFVRGCNYIGEVSECSQQVAVPDAMLAAKVAEYNTPISAMSDEVVGETLTELTGRGDDLAPGTASMGNLVADVMLDYAKGTDQAVAAVANRGGVRASISKGTVRFKDVNAVLPFDNNVLVLELTGSELLAAMDYAVTGAGGKSYGAFPYVSGMEIRYCKAAPCPAALRKTDDARITELKVGGAPVDVNAKYRVAANDYIARGGDYYDVFKSVCERAGAYCRNTGGLLKTVVADWFRAHSPVKGSAEQRVVAQ